MAEVQPLLGHLLDVLGSGRGEQINRLIDRSGRDGAGADGFVQTYNRVVANGGKVRLGPVQFSGRQEGDALAVDGVVLLMLHDENRQPVTRELVLKALFASRGGQPVMTQVTASELAR